MMEKIYLHIIEKQGFMQDLMSQYKPSDVLGKGSQAKVYLARHVLS